MKIFVRAVAIVIWATLLTPAPASDANAIGGDKFLALCSNDANQSDHDFCLGYVFAIAEALHGVPDATVCLRDASPESLLESTMSYIVGVPALEEQSSGELVVTALESSYPC